MNGVKLILTEPVPPPALLIGSAAAGRPAEQQKEQAAKDFESVLIARILEQVRNTIPDSGLLEDKASEQMEGLFWLYLASELADKGGFGLWKQICQALTSGEER
jgi:Rod binding domain-containing protein